MRLQWLGDALDHWKGSLFELLQEREVLRDFCVDPMATDLDGWLDLDYDTYADLLRVAPIRVVRHERSLAERHGYFAEVPKVQDIFLDPDTGVATGRVQRHEQYVLVDDIWRLLFDGFERMVVVYQHVRAIPTATRISQVTHHVDRGESLAWCSYESGTVAMLFFSLSAQRIQSVEQAFRTKLGRHSAPRIRAVYRPVRSNKGLDPTLR